MIVKYSTLIYNYQEITSKKTGRKWGVVGLVLDGAPKKMFVGLDNEAVLQSKPMLEYLKDYKIRTCEAEINVQFTENGVRTDLLKLT